MIATVEEILNVKRQHFYQIVDEYKKAEFINGETFVHQSDTFVENKAASSLLALINTFVNKNELGFVGFQTLMVSLTRNDYEPDVCFFGVEKSQHFTRKQMKFPEPDFVAEVLSDSTAKNDRETKFRDYAAHDVKEYWIIDAENETIEQFALRGEDYELLLKAKNGTITSEILTNFTIDVRAVFDEAINLQNLTKLLSE
ncbi:MAG: Uma2 family endonuclease [Pyrinomonadaceae bacterium]|nr:Uma2 family endonuclease [Pyrinomonadaceae bacterium]